MKLLIAYSEFMLSLYAVYLKVKLVYPKLRSRVMYSILIHVMFIIYSMLNDTGLCTVVKGSRYINYSIYIFIKLQGIVSISCTGLAD